MVTLSIADRFSNFFNVRNWLNFLQDTCNIFHHTFATPVGNNIAQKKHVLWNAGICPIAEIVINTMFDDNIKTHDRY